MQPDRTLVQLVSWVNLIEEENEKLLNAARGLQEQNKKFQTEIDKLTAEVEQLRESEDDGV